MHTIDNKLCWGRINYPFIGIDHITMIAVGVGIAPMIQTLRTIIKDNIKYTNSRNTESDTRASHTCIKR